MTTLIMFVDNRGLFDCFGRLQSWDRTVAQRILDIAHGRKIEFRAPQETPLLYGAKRTYPEDPTGRVVLKATGSYDSVLREADELIVINWGRDYPGTRTFLLPDGWEQTEQKQYAGYSHQVITETWYRRAGD